MKDKDCLIALSAFSMFGSVRLALLLDFYKNPSVVWDLSQSQLISVGVSPKLARNFAEFRNHFDVGEFKRENKRLGIKMITILDDSYPINLRGLSGMPFVIYVKGDFQKRDINAVSIVGSRLSTSYGERIAKEFSEYLAKNGVTIISGLARGIDTIVHKSVLNVEGRTIAVMGTGLDRVYPTENKKLADSIIENGILISEYPIDHPVFPENFVERNRIVTGLSKILMVVEGREKSGTLTSSSFAANQGKTVVAIPGNVYSDSSFVPNMLIKNGAKLVTSPQEILVELSAL